VHRDCGVIIFADMDKVHCGGSGCGCSGITLNGYFMKKLLDKEISKILFVATGALLSPTIVQQGESIPGIAHAVVIERRNA
ncbi:MAG: stage V sporulation protein AD, partial [Lachnospiraceae bacterium]